MNKKHTLVIDGNYFLFRTLYVLPRNKGKILDTKADVGIFVRKLATDFASEIRKFRTMVDQVVFTIDSKSWRKDFYPESEYKGNRSSDESINWENFVKGGEDFKEFLKSKGVILHKVNGAEGDDLIFAWSVNANYREKPVIVFSGDRDLLQLVNYNQSTRSYTIFYSNTHKKLCVFKGFSDWLEREEHQVTDIFDMQKSVEGDNIIRNGLKSLIKDSKLNLEEIHPGEFAFKKVLTGDAGDNVPGIKGVGPKTIAKLYPELADDVKMTLTEVIDKAKEGEGKAFMSIRNFEHQLKINEKLMDLTNPNIPDDSLVEINEMLENPNKTFRSKEFMSLYEEDDLGNSISNLQTWLHNNFYQLSKYK
jgi:DNA polymerase-1